MARTNKYASLNFNEIYEKKIKNNTLNNNNTQNSTTSSPIHNKTILSNSRIHGNMLVLSRPTPKPILQPSPSPPPSQSQPPQPTTPDRTGFHSDSISLRPLGSTGSGPIIVPVLKERDLSVSPKPNKFVPPHLRPGFAGKEEKPVQFTRVGSPVGENGRPKSGGGYDMRRGREVDPIRMVRPGSSGSRPSSSGL